MGEYGKFLHGLSEQLSSRECGDLAYLAGVSGESPDGGSGCCCCRLPACSPGLALLRRMERIGLFSKRCLGRLAQFLDDIGRKDLAAKCVAAKFLQDSADVDQESGCDVQESGSGTSESGRGVQESIVADRCRSCDHPVVESFSNREDFTNSCPVPPSNVRGDNSAHQFTASAIVGTSSSRSAAPTVTESARCSIQLEVTRRREFFRKLKSKLMPASKSFPSRSESASPDEFNENSYLFVNSADIPSPSSLDFISISPSSTSDTPPLVTLTLDTPTSTTSRDLSPSRDLTVCDSNQTTVHDTAAFPAEVNNSSHPVLRGKSLDIATPKVRPVSMPFLRSFTNPKIFGRRPFQKFMSDSRTGVSGLERNGDSEFPPSFTWNLSIPDLLSKIAKKQTKPLEKKFFARTQADDNKFCLELVLKLCPIGLDFERDSYCTLTVEVSDKKTCGLSSQQVKLQVLGRAGADRLKEVGKVCLVGGSQRVPEFLSHDVLRCSEAKCLELEFNLHLQYELDGEEATWEFIGKDFVL